MVYVLGYNANWRVNFPQRSHHIFYVHLFNCLSFSLGLCYVLVGQRLKKADFLFPSFMWIDIYIKECLFLSEHNIVFPLFTILYGFVFSPNIFFRSSFVLKALFPLFLKLVLLWFLNLFVFFENFQKVNFLSPLKDFPFHKKIKIIKKLIRFLKKRFALRIL